MCGACAEIELETFHGSRAIIASSVVGRWGERELLQIKQSRRGVDERQGNKTTRVKEWKIESLFAKCNYYLESIEKKPFHVSATDPDTRN